MNQNVTINELQAIIGQQQIDLFVLRREVSRQADEIQMLRTAAEAVVKHAEEAANAVTESPPELKGE